MLLEQLAHSLFLPQIFQSFLSMALGDAQLMAIDEAGSTEIGSSLNPEAAQFERDIAYRATHAIQTKVAPDAEGAWEEP